MTAADAYFELGGVELWNQARTAAYAANLSGISIYPCDGLDELLGLTYVDPATDVAWWYDTHAQVVDLASRFYGFVPLPPIVGIDDSSAEVPVIDSTGGVPYPGRRTDQPRRLQVRLLAVGLDCCATAYGITALRNRVRRNATDRATARWLSCCPCDTAPYGGLDNDEWWRELAGILAAEVQVVTQRGASNCPRCAGSSLVEVQLTLTGSPWVTRPLAAATAAVNLSAGSSVAVEGAVSVSVDRDTVEAKCEVPIILFGDQTWCIFGDDYVVTDLQQFGGDCVPKVVRTVAVDCEPYLVRLVENRDEPAMPNDYTGYRFFQPLNFAWDEVSPTSWGPCGCPIEISEYVILDSIEGNQTLAPPDGPAAFPITVEWYNTYNGYWRVELGTYDRDYDEYPPAGPAGRYVWEPPTTCGDPDCQAGEVTVVLSNDLTWDTDGTWVHWQSRFPDADVIYLPEVVDGEPTLVTASDTAWVDPIVFSPLADPAALPTPPPMTANSIVFDLPASSTTTWHTFDPARDWSGVIPVVDIDTGGGELRWLEVLVWANPFALAANATNFPVWQALGHWRAQYLPGSTTLRIDGRTGLVMATVSGQVVDGAAGVQVIRGFGAPLSDVAIVVAVKADPGAIDGAATSQLYVAGVDG